MGTDDLKDMLRAMGADKALGEVAALEEENVRLKRVIEWQCTHLCTRQECNGCPIVNDRAALAGRGE